HVAKARDGNRGVHFPNHSLDGPRQRGRWQCGPYHHIHTRRSNTVLVKGDVKFSPRLAVHPALPDVLGYADHRVPDIGASAKGPTRGSQPPANRILTFPDSFRQSLIDDG